MTRIRSIQRLHGYEPESPQAAFGQYRKSFEGGGNRRSDTFKSQVLVADEAGHDGHRDAKRVSDGFRMP